MAREVEAEAVHRQRLRDDGYRRGAFTLIELLAVIGVISMLLATIMPSLKSARSQAQRVVCSANLSSIGQAAAAYSADWNGWMCGSPGTSGSVMYGADPRPAPRAEDIDTDPVQIWDYAGPLAAKYMNMSLPANRAERFGELVKGVFACPSNHFKADPYPNEVGSFKTQPMVSYNTFRNFMMWPRTRTRGASSERWGDKAPHLEASFDRIGGASLHPKGYAPQLGRLANPASKAYLADGNRYTDRLGRLTYDLEWDALAGGAFCNGGPTLLETNGSRWVLSAYHTDKRLGDYAYRHNGGGERGIVVNYFDGHTEFMTETQSRHPDTWWPKGTRIPFSEFNEASGGAIAHRLDDDSNYVVGR